MAPIMMMLAMSRSLDMGRAAQQLPSSETGPTVRVESDASGKRIAYSTTSSACRVSWEVLRDETGGGEIRHYSSCLRSWDDMAPSLSAVAAAVLGKPARRRVIWILTWGRLAPDGSIEARMAQRLAAAASRSPLWDRKLGRPKTGDINRFIRDLANEDRIYSDLENILAPAGVTVTVRTVEKVLAGRAGDLPYFDALRRLGIRAEDKLPFDCQIWFQLTPK